MRQIFASIAVVFLMISPVFAECSGRNLFLALPAADQAALRAVTDAAPFARGNFWRATRSELVVTLVGTFHLDDPRHDSAVAALTPLLVDATTLLVEAGPVEEQQIKSYLARHPEVMIDNHGPTWPEVLSPPDWARLSDALRARGIPPFMAAKFRPMYLAMLLAIPPCSFGLAEQRNGLDMRLMAAAIDMRLMAAATDLGIPVQALEPFDTILKVFDGHPAKDQQTMILQSVWLDDQNASLAVSMADAYFWGESRLIWEYSRYLTQSVPGISAAEVDRQFALTEQSLINTRNKSWIPVIEAEARQGPIVVAFGAMHLSGDLGVLRLLENVGFTLEPIAFN